MLGLAVLFFKGLWIIITIVAMVIGAKFGRKPATWTIEYIQIQRTVTHLCETEGGIRVYVTPEEWRKQIGEEEWLKLYPYSWEEQGNYQKGTLLFKGREYKTISQSNSRVMVYAIYKKAENYILGNYSLYYDIKGKIPLFSVNSFNVGTGPIPDELKFWINSINDCNYKTFINRKNELLNKYTNSRRKQ